MYTIGHLLAPGLLAHDELDFGGQDDCVPPACT